MGAIVVGVLVIAVFVWLARGGPARRRPVAPEDDVTTPIDRDELAAAERELADAPDPSDLDDEDDDWGPGAASGR
ncbi:MAG: hypothetical protein FJ206_02950 [Gemmatimonadetes bacterium]|nr:hypothetical protein [Gemmatimonadota bacterium]